MATKFYLESSGTPAISPTPNAGWTDTSQFTRFNTGTTKASSAMTTKNISDAISTQADILIGQWISDFLTPGQTITGLQTVSIQARFSETNNSNNLFMAWGVYVFNGTTLKKTIVTKRNDGTEVALTTLTNRTDSAPSTSGNYTTVNGDRIVIEIGLEGDPTSSSTHDGAMSYGSNSATDLPSDNTTTAADNPNVILANTLTLSATTTSTSSSSSSSISTSSSSSSISVSTSTTMAISWNNYLFTHGTGGSFSERIRGDTFGH